MSVPEKLSRRNYNDAILASIVGAIGLTAYLRTLAPDILFADSAEFQTLAFTSGIAHPTGYPAFLLLAKLFTYLPLNTVAWRVNFMSAVMGSLALVVMYFLIRRVTNSQAGAVLGSLALGIGYTYWSQAIIAEVYTTAALCLVVILLLLWNWQENVTRRGHLLFFVGLIGGLGFHITIELIAPAVVVFVIWTLAAGQRSWQAWKSILWGVGGLLLGVAIFILTFYFFDLNNPSSSYLNVTLLPSRSMWGATMADLDSFSKRLYAAVMPLQFRHSLFSGSLTFMWTEFKHYAKWMLFTDLGPLPVVLAGLGAGVIVWRKPRWGGFLGLTFSILLFFIFNYRGSGKFVFYLSTYVPILIAAGAGTGLLMEKLHNFEMKFPRLFRLPVIKTPLFSLVAGALLFLVLVLPFWGSRVEALRAGAATFVKEDDTYPVQDLQGPRQQAQKRLNGVENKAVFLLDWKTIYPLYYLSEVEKVKPGITVLEDCIDVKTGLLPETLVEQLDGYLRAGRPVYSDRAYPLMESSFTFEAVSGTDLMRVRLK